MLLRFPSTPTLCFHARKKKTENEGEAAAARATACNGVSTAAVRDKKDEATNAAAAQCKSRSGSMSIVADRAEAAVARHKLDEEEIAKDNQTTNRVAAKEQADAATAAKGPAAAAAAHKGKEKMNIEGSHGTGEAVAAIMTTKSDEGMLRS